MSSTRLIVDGLWHCLCPSFNKSILFHQSIRQFSVPTRRSVHKISTKRRTPYPSTTRANSKQDEKDVLDSRGESIPVLYDLLRTCASRGRTTDVDKIVDHLVRERGETPNVRLYSSLILANVNPQHGSPDRASWLVDEMTSSGLAVDSGVCHDVLKVGRI